MADDVSRPQVNSRRVVDSGRQGMFRYLVLALLRHLGPLHGFGLMREYRARSGVRLSAGNFYRELQHLVGDGLIRACVNPPGADPRRMPYELTEAGRRVIDAWLAAVPARLPPHPEDELSARLLFADTTEPETIRRLLNRWQEELWIRGKALERIREQGLSQTGGQVPEGELSILASLISRRLKHLAADVEFLNEFRAEYEAWLKAKEVKEKEAAEVAGATRGNKGKRAKEARKH